VVVNQAISTLRRGPKAPALEFQDYHAAADDGQEQVGLAMDLEAALATLNQEDRAVVWLHDVEGYGHQEIADMFGKTESFSKTRLSRARAKLRDLLDSPAAAPATGVAASQGSGRSFS
jgi:RNA polymerase sigma-70 factor (ECF subfamily)